MSGWGTILNNTNYALRMHSSRLADLQAQAATGMRIQRPSDAPNDAYRVLDLRNQSLTTETYRKNLDAVILNLQTASDSLQQISPKVSRVTDLLTQVASGTYNAGNRELIAQEIDSLLEQIVSLANTDNLGQHIFAGSATDKAPYQVDRVDGRIVAVRYEGSATELPVPVAPGVEYSGVLVGDRVFRMNDRAEPVFLGDTGAAAGQGTASVRGDVWLLVNRTDTTYQPASGLAKSADAGADTILGLHTLHIDGPAGTIRLDDGTVQNFDGTETNLTLTNGAGELLHVDTTGFDMGTAGDFTVTGEGSLSIDEGATSVAIDFADANQAVTDSNTGRVLYVDSRNITNTGAEPVRLPGTYDVFGALIDVRDLLMNTRDLPEAQQQELISQAIGSIDELFQELSKSMAAVGGRLQAMDALSVTLDGLKFSADDQISLLADADIAQVAADLARTQTLYEMTLVSASKLLSLSLLDFI